MDIQVKSFRYNGKSYCVKVYGNSHCLRCHVYLMRRKKVVDMVEFLCPSTWYAFVALDSLDYYEAQACRKYFASIFQNATDINFYQLFH